MKTKTTTRRPGIWSNEIQFDNAFIFRYSTRRDTPAATMAGQIDEQVKEQRNQDLLSVVDASAHRANERLVGRDVEILCEGPSRTNAARLMGRTRTNKIVVFEGEPGARRRDFRCRRPTGERIQLVWNAGRANLLSDSRMIYHLSLQTAGLIAGLFLLLVSVPGLVKPELARDFAQRLPRSRVAGFVLLTIDLFWSLWLLATMEMGEFSSFPPAAAHHPAHRFFSRLEVRG